VTDPAPKTLHTLLHTIVDYAGLFPPAGLEMTPAVRNYADYRQSPHAWMLGRFVAPVARLDEFAASLASVGDRADGRHWRVSALVGDDVAGDVARIGAFNAADRGAVVDAIEVKASSTDAIGRIAAASTPGLRAYVEIPVADDPRPLVGAIAASKLRAKIRTGGVVPGAFPSASHVTRFVRACYATGTGFKATAGLHHPVRSTQPLTYAPEAPRGVMHGFLNVFLTAVFHYNGLTIRDADELMEREAFDDIEFSGDTLAWRDYRLSRDELATIRRRFAISFGSCSFREPVDDLIRMGWLS
jgi:hypothetical protein